MTHFHGKVAVITGAASGIGRALALELARRGARLAISDIDAEGLAETERAVRVLGAEVDARFLDVAQPEQIADYAGEVLERFGVVHQLYNNAGIAYTGTVEEMDDKAFQRVMDVDFWGVVHTTKAFLPHLIASGDGHIVNVSSVFGILAVPTQSAYNAAKFAVRGYTEALAMEMRLAGHPVKVTCVHPGGIKTNIARNADQAAGRDHDRLARAFDRLARTSPEGAARVILAGVRRGRSRVLIGADAQVFDKAARILGPRYQGAVAWFARRQGL